MREAEFIIGQEDLCRALDIGAAQLQRWIGGEERVPEMAFCWAVDIILNAPERIRRSGQNWRPA
jgi:hypothetical protein